MIPYILFALLASATYADTWLADGQTLGSSPGETVSELTFENGVRLSGSSNGVSVLIGTNLYPLLKEGDVPPPDLPVFDDFSIVDQPTGAKGVAPRYDLNDSLFAWHISQLEGAAIGMVDGWFWSPDSEVGIAGAESAVFVAGQGYLNYSGDEPFALNFDGSSWGITTEDSGADGAEGLTIQTWVRGNDSGFAILAHIGQWYGTANGLISYVQAANNYTISAHPYGAGADPYWGFNPPSWLTEWVHVVGTVSTNKIQIYLNGVFYEEQTATSSGFQDGPMEIATLGGIYKANAKFDEVVFWNRVLSSNEIFQLYNGGDGYYLTESDPLADDVIAIYHLDEGTGSDAGDTGGAGKTMTLYEEPGWVTGKVAAPQTLNEASIQSETIGVDFVPATVRAVVMTQADTLLNTNHVSLSVSRDNGITWSGVALAEVPYPSSDSTYQLFSGLSSVTNQPSGTQIVFRVTQSATAAQTLCGVGGSWR